MTKEFEYIIPAEEKGKRLDLYLASKKELELTRSHVQKLIEDSHVRVNKEISKPSYKVKTDDRIWINIPPPREPTALPENIPLEIIYEDAEIIVVNKPRGMVVHPAPGNYNGTLVNALLYHCDHLAPTGAPLRPGIVHRLDKDTSGLIVIAKTDAAYHSLVKQLKDRTVEKTYITLAHGAIENHAGIIEARIGRHPVHRKKMIAFDSRQLTVDSRQSREAITYYKVLERFENYTLVEVQIKTGRTHQIRVHMNYIGHPVVGDPTYGKKNEEFEVKGQLLHAGKLGFIHPKTGKHIEFEAEMPEDMLKVLRSL